MPHYDFDEFLQRVKHLEFNDIVDTAHEECRKLEKSSSKYKKADSLMLTEQIRGLLYWLRTLRKPKKLSTVEFLKFRPLCETLIAKAQLKPEALHAFNLKTAA